MYAYLILDNGIDTPDEIQLTKGERVLLTYIGGIENTEYIAEHDGSVITLIARKHAYGTYTDQLFAHYRVVSKTYQTLIGRLRIRVTRNA